MTVLIFKKLRRFVWKKLSFSITKLSSKFSTNSNCRINLFFYARCPKLGRFAFFRYGLSISGIFFKLQPIMIPLTSAANDLFRIFWCSVVSLVSCAALRCDLP